MLHEAKTDVKRRFMACQPGRLPNSLLAQTDGAIGQLACDKNHYRGRPAIALLLVIRRTKNIHEVSRLHTPKPAVNVSFFLGVSGLTIEMYCWYLGSILNAFLDLPGEVIACPHLHAIEHEMHQ